MGAGVCRGEEVPERVGRFAEVVHFLGGEEGDSWVLRVCEGHLVAEGDGGSPGCFGAGHSLEGGEAVVECGRW